MDPKGSDDVEQLGLKLVQLLLPAGGIGEPLLEANRNSIELLDLLEHSVGRAPELAESPLLGQRAVAALHQLSVREFLGSGDRLLDAGAGNAAVVLVGDLGRCLGEHQATEVLDPVVAQAQRDEEFLPVNGDRSDLVVGANGGGHCTSRLGKPPNCNALNGLNDTEKYLLGAMGEAARGSLHQVVSVPDHTKNEPGPENLASAISEVVEIQQRIEKTARSLVDGMRRRVDAREHLAPANLKDFAGYDYRFYDMTGKELADRGLRVLGDFADPSMLERPVEQRSFYRFALSEDTTTTASWFVAKRPRDSRGIWLRLRSRLWSMLVPSTKKEALRCLVLHSWCEDGRVFVTMRGTLESHVMRPEWLIVQDLDKYISAARAVDAHREAVAAGGGVPRRLRSVEEIMAARAAEDQMEAEFREAKGLELFEPMLRGMLGAEYDERGAPLVEAILAHPEWWTGQQASPLSLPSPGEQEVSPAPNLPGPAAPIRLMFLSSQDGGRGHLTTFGLLFEGLPEMQMKQLAGNHWRAARFLLGTVSKKLRHHPARSESGEAFHSELRTGLTLTLGRDDVSPGEPMVVWGRYPEAGSGVAGPAVVRLKLEAFDEQASDPDTELLHLLPPVDYRADKDTWLRDVCRSLGQNAPDPLPFESLDTEMEAASARARATLGAVRERFRRGLPAGQTLAIKIGLTTSAGDREFVWIKVDNWQADGILTGTLETEPNQCPGFQKGQVMRVPESDVFDRAIGSAEGLIEPAFTDIVAQEFGVDL